MEETEGGEAVSHHVRDATKMISKTPRTDRQPVVTVAFQQFVKIGFARQLERQLAGANKRIKELELKEDELNDLKKWLEGR